MERHVQVNVSHRARKVGYLFRRGSHAWRVICALALTFSAGNDTGAGTRTSVPQRQAEVASSQDPPRDSRQPRPITTRHRGSTRGVSSSVMDVRLCQGICPNPAHAQHIVAPAILEGVDCSQCPGPGEATWHARRPIPWQVLAQGEYIGPFRLPHVPEYRLRVDDLLEFIYRLTRVKSSKPYEFQVGDRLQVESLVDQDLNRELIVQPDGTITLRLVGQVMAAGRTVQELKDTLEQLYEKFYKIPDITLTPIVINTKLEDLRNAVDRRSGVGGQSVEARVTPEGTIQLTAIGSVPAQGLTIEELKREIDERYAEIVDGIEVTPVLVARAPRFAYVVGEVASPGRFELAGPTTVMQTIALAGGWNVGANLRQVVVFRRAEDWRLLATKLDLRGALYGKRPCPADEIWVRDSDIVLVPKSPVLVIDDHIELLFTRGFYGVLPFFGADNDFPNLSTIN